MWRIKRGKNKQTLQLEDHLCHTGGTYRVAYNKLTYFVGNCSSCNLERNNKSGQFFANQLSLNSTRDSAAKATHSQGTQCFVLVVKSAVAPTLYKMVADFWRSAKNLLDVNSAKALVGLSVSLILPKQMGFIRVTNSTSNDHRAVDWLTTSTWSYSLRE